MLCYSLASTNWEVQRANRSNIRSSVHNGHLVLKPYDTVTAALDRKSDIQ